MKILRALKAVYRITGPVTYRQNTSRPKYFSRYPELAGTG